MSQFIMVSLLCLCCLVLAAFYFRRVAIKRPPIGVINRTDIWVILLAIVLLPVLYLSLPAWGLVLLLAPSAVGIAYVTLEPLVHARPMRWLASIGLVVADILTAATYGTGGRLFLAVNDLVIIVLIVGVSNLWVQSGMKAVHVACL